MANNTKKTLIGLQDILFETLNEVHKAEGGTKAFGYTMEKAEYEAKIAKQLINNADVILRADKLVGKGERIDGMVG